MTTLTRSTALVCGALLLSTLAACGSDDDVPATTSGPAGGDAAAGSTADIPGDRMVEALGKAGVIAAQGIEDFEVDGNRLIFKAPSVKGSESMTTCVILDTAAGSLPNLPDDLEVIVRFSDGEQNCTKATG